MNEWIEIFHFPLSVFHFSLTKDIPYLIDKRFVGKIHILDLGKLFEQFALLLGKRFWRNERNSDKKIAFPAPAEIRHSVRLNAKDSSRLRTGRNL